MGAQRVEAETSGIRSKVEELARWRRRLEIHVPAVHTRRVRHHTVRRFAKRAKLKGFRPGKAPPTVVEKQFAPEIDRAVLEDLVREGFETGVKEAGLEPIGTPRFRNVHWTSGGDLEFAAEFDIRPEIELARTTGFRVEERVRRVSDADVDRVVERLRRDRADWIPVDRPAAIGDRVRFDSVPLDERGEAMDSERIENQVVELGTGSLLPDFETGLTGQTAGQEVVLDVRFPDDHPNEFLRGRSRRFRVKIDEVRERSLPDADDAFARSLGSFESLTALKEQLRKNLEEEIHQQSRREVHEALIDEIIAANRIEIPESMVEQYLANLLSDGREGVDPERESEIRQVLRPGAERALKRHYILNYIADREGLRPTDSEVDVAIAERIDPESTSVAEARRRLAKAGELDDLEFHLTMERVFAWLRERSRITPVEVAESDA